MPMKSAVTSGIVEGFGCRPRCKPHRCNRPASETLNRSRLGNVGVTTAPLGPIRIKVIGFASGIRFQRPQHLRGWGLVDQKARDAQIPRTSHTVLLANAAENVETYRLR